MNKKGFTLVEILVAATIVAILSVIGIVSYASINKRSRDAKRLSDLEQVRSALEMFRSETNSYPGHVATFSELTGLQDDLVPVYLPGIPMDPKSTDTVPLNYYYKAIGVTNYFAYCICAGMESTTKSVNNCNSVAEGDIPANVKPTNYPAYYCVYSP